VYGLGEGPEKENETRTSCDKVWGKPEETRLSEVRNFVTSNRKWL
jgi:hypothetical protein